MEEEYKETIANPAVVELYMKAGEIVNAAMNAILQEMVPGASVAALCAKGDAYIKEGCNNVTEITDKGIAFPTCMNVNNTVGHYSPVNPNVSDYKLKAGDVVKVDMAAQIDGYSSVAAHTWIVPPTGGQQEAMGGDKAAAICAAYFASECALRLLRPGKTNNEITRVMNQCIDIFKCNAVEGVLSHSLHRYAIDGRNVIIGKADVDNQVEEHELVPNEVYALDVVVSTGEGKTRESGEKTSIYMNIPENTFNPRMQAAKQLKNNINRHYKHFPFNPRNMPDERKARLGLSELIKHDCVQPFPVLEERKGAIVAQFKFTILVFENNIVRLNSFQLPWVSSEYSTDSDAEIAALLAQPTGEEYEEAGEGGEDAMDTT